MLDFTLTTYKKLLQELISSGYSFQTLEDFIQQPKEKIVILRHDVDRKPEKALAIARIENDASIKAGYYFRIVKESCDENIIKQIAKMGHETGYHYENLTTCGGDLRLAIDDFRLNLKKFRRFYPTKTICMHGSPLSKWDNRELWKHYDYQDYGIIAEPYFDVDFSEVLYLTDTGRRWDGDKVNVRDKILRKKGRRLEGEKTSNRDKVGETEVAAVAPGCSSWSNSTSVLSAGTTGQPGQGCRNAEFAPAKYASPLSAQISRGNRVGGLRFRSTWDIIEAADMGLLPDKIMINAHP